MERKHNKMLTENAKILRNNMTKEEKHLWYDYLKKCPVRFSRQKVLGKYIADFYSAEAKIVIELDGVQHSEEENRIYDEKRTEFLEQYNLKIIRIPNNYVLENFEGGYYGSNEFREAHSKFFENKLWKGETVYYEVVGFTHTGTPIMATADNKKLNDKEFIKQYGKETVFSYGCEPNGKKAEAIIDEELGHGVAMVDTPQSDIYVYRMTMTNEDGNVIEYTPDFMRYRCEQMGAKCCPLLAKAYIRDEGVFVVDNEGEEYGIPYETDIGEMVKFVSETYFDGPDPIGKNHVREGVVVRIVNRPKFAAYKHKNFSFKVLEGIIKAEAEAPDMEEAQDGEV